MTAVPSDDARSGGHNGRARPGASLRFRFALTIVGVSAAVVASFGAVVHRQMSESATRGASEHLERAVREVSNMLGGSAKSMLAAMAGVAADTDVVEFLRRPDERRAEAAREALRRLSPAPGKADVELWTASGVRTRASDSNWPEMAGASRTSLMDMVRGSDATAVTPIALFDTTLVYEVVARVGSRGVAAGLRRRAQAGDGARRRWIRPAARRRRLGRVDPSGQRQGRHLDGHGAPRPDAPGGPRGVGRRRVRRAAARPSVRVRAFDREHAVESRHRVPARHCAARGPGRDDDHHHLRSGCAADRGRDVMAFERGIHPAAERTGHCRRTDQRRRLRPSVARARGRRDRCRGERVQPNGVELTW